MNSNITKSTLLVLAVFSTSPLVHAAVVETDNFSTTSYTAFPASNSDLIETGSSAITGSPTISGPSTFGTSANAVALMTNGVVDNFAAWYDNATNATPTIVTYQFDLSQNILGYDLSSLNSIAAYDNGGNNYINQDFSIYVSYVAAPTSFQLLDSVAYNPLTSSLATGIPSSSEVTLTGSTGSLASGVAAIQFQFGSNGSAGQIISEMDVFGSPTLAVPEPSTDALLLLGLGLGAVLFVSRARFHQVD